MSLRRKAIPLQMSEGHLESFFLTLEHWAEEVVQFVELLQWLCTLEDVSLFSRIYFLKPRHGGAYSYNPEPRRERERAAWDLEAHWPTTLVSESLQKIEKEKGEEETGSKGGRKEGEGLSED